MTDYDAVLHLVTHGAAFEVGLFAMLSVYRLEDGRYSVFYDPDGNPFGKNCVEKLYKDPRRAVRKFLQWRDELKLGFDWELGKR